MGRRGSGRNWAYDEGTSREGSDSIGVTVPSRNGCPGKKEEEKSWICLEK